MPCGNEPKLYFIMNPLTLRVNRLYLHKGKAITGWPTVLGMTSLYLELEGQETDTYLVRLSEVRSNE